MGIDYMPVKLHFNEEVLEKTVQRCREQNIIIPTFAQLKNPQELVPQAIKERLVNVGLWDVDPINLFRITWKNDISTGLYGRVNRMELPSQLTGLSSRLIGLVGKYFPTGAHKVGAAFGCLVPRLISGEFDPTTQKAVWPSTGNYCRGGAFDCALLSTQAVAILPEEMSQERFDWLRSIGAEVIATPGSESNVKEIYDKCWELRETDPGVVIFNQFDEFGNAIFHHEVTGAAIEEMLREEMRDGQHLAAYVSATGSAGTIAAGDYLKKVFHGSMIVAGEALQCPTLYNNGFGAHRIEGIGDKHVPWIHNTRNTDAVAAIDDEDVVRIFRLFNEDEGKKVLEEYGVPSETIENLSLLGLSSIGNMLSSIKTAKYFEMDGRDVLVTVFTDSADMYQSRIEEYRRTYGPMTRDEALITMERRLLGQPADHYRELGYWDRKSLHNLKYFTWIEQQKKDLHDLNQLWDPEFWDQVFSIVPEWDRAIEEFNSRTGLLESL